MGRWQRCAMRLGGNAPVDARRAVTSLPEVAHRLLKLQAHDDLQRASCASQRRAAEFASLSQRQSHVRT